MNRRWRHQMETFSALLALCARNSPVTGEFPAQRPVTQIFDVFFDPHLNKRLSKQTRVWWFETPSRAHYDVIAMRSFISMMVPLHRSHIHIAGNLWGKCTRHRLIGTVVLYFDIIFDVSLNKLRSNRYILLLWHHFVKRRNIYRVYTI